MGLTGDGGQAVTLASDSELQAQADIAIFLALDHRRKLLIFF